VEWSEDDQCYIGKCPGFFFAGCHGDDEAEVYAELCRMVDEWVEICQRDGKPLPAATAGKSYSGKFILRADAELHQQLAIAALQAGESLNRYCVDVLKERVSPDMGSPMMPAQS